MIVGLARSRKKVRAPIGGNDSRGRLRGIERGVATLGGEPDKGNVDVARELVVKKRRTLLKGKRGSLRLNRRTERGSVRSKGQVKGRQSGMTGEGNRREVAGHVQQRKRRKPSQRLSKWGKKDDVNEAEGKLKFTEESLKLIKGDESSGGFGKGGGERLLIGMKL